jgi:hypothetical protein
VTWTASRRQFAAGCKERFVEAELRERVEERRMNKSLLACIFPSPIFLSPKFLSFVAMKGSFNREMIR